MTLQVYYTRLLSVCQWLLYTILRCIICAKYTLDFSVLLCYNVYGGKEVRQNRSPKTLESRYIMAIKYKLDVIAALKDAGYSTYKLRKDKILSESTLQKFRDGELISYENLNRICSLLNCQPGDIIEYVDESEI